MAARAARARLPRAEELLAEMGLAQELASRSPGAAFRRPASAGEYCARLVRGAEAAGGRRDRFGTGCVGAGAVAQSAAAAARGAGFRHAVHLARSLGGAASVRPRAGDVSRRDRGERADRRGVCGAAARLHEGAAGGGAAGRSVRADCADVGSTAPKAVEIVHEDVEHVVLVAPRLAGGVRRDQRVRQPPERDCRRAAPR